MSQPLSLYEALGEVPDPRDASGRRHPLPAVLTLTSVAILSGARSLYAIAQFGRDRGKEFAAALGFTRDVPPCCSTLHYLFKAMDRKAFEAAVRRWARGRCDAAGWRAVLEQIPVGAKTNEHKAALELLDLVPVKGKLFTGDAMFCQRDLSGKISKKGGTGFGRSRRTSPTSWRPSPTPSTTRG